MTPFQALYGYGPPKVFCVTKFYGSSSKEPLRGKPRIINLLKENLTMARNRMKQQAN